MIDTIDYFRCTMTHKLIPFLFVLLGWAGSGAGAADSELPSPGLQEAQQVKEAKKILHFGSWPGKHGPLKPGVKFVPASVPALAGFAVTADSLEVAKIDELPFLHRTVALSHGAVNVSIDIEVSQKSTDDAHEALLSAALQTQAEVQTSIRGDQNGITVGDLNFVDSLDPTRRSWMAFARNNLSVTVVGGNGPLPQLVDIAAAIDALIVKEPDFSPANLMTQIPVISEFTPQSSSIAQLASTAITLAASDPQQRVLQYIFTGSGPAIQIQADRSKSPPAVTILSSNQAGKAVVSLLVVNENLLYATARAEVTILQ